MADQPEHARKDVEGATSDSATRADARRRAIGTVVALVLVALALVLSVVWAQMGRALEVGERVTDKVDGVTFTLNTDMAGFKGTAATAQKIEPKLRAGQEVLRQQLAVIESMRGVPSVGNYREEMRSYVESATAYYDDVLVTVSFVNERSEAVKEIGRAFNALSEATTATTSQEIIAKAGEAAAAAGSAVNRLRSMDASANAAYVNTALVDHLNELRTALADLSTGLLKRDTPAIVRAGARLGQLLKADWESLFYQADASTLQRLTAEAKSLETQRRAIDSARTAIEGQRPILGLAAIVFLLLAALIAAWAWLR